MPQRTSQQGRFVERDQALAPEALTGSGVPSLQPVDVVAVLAELRRQRFTPVECQHLTHLPSAAPAVGDQVVAGPQQVVAALTQAHQSQTLQRRHSEIEAFGTLGRGQRIQCFGLGGLRAPVVFTYR